MLDENRNLKRNRKMRRITKDVALLIEDCRKYFEMECRNGKSKNLNRPLQRTMECFGIGKNTISSLRKKFNEGFEFPDSEEKETRQRDGLVPQMIYETIRRTIFQMFQQKKHVTLDTLMVELQEERATRMSAWIW